MMTVNSEPFGESNIKGLKLESVRKDIEALNTANNSLLDDSNASFNISLTADSVFMRPRLDSLKNKRDLLLSQNKSNNGSLISVPMTTSVSVQYAEDAKTDQIDESKQLKVIKEESASPQINNSDTSILVGTRFNISYKLYFRVVFK